MKPILIALIAGLTWQCAVGPEFKKPQVELAETWSNSTPNQTQDQPEGQWWLHFKDPVLNELIAAAETQNHDIRIAAARLRQAQAATGIAKKNGQPTVNLEGSYTRNRISVNGADGNAFAVQSGLAPRDINRYGVAARFSWELDAFGHIQRAVEGAEARTQVAQAALADAHRLIRAAVGREYLALRGAQNHLSVVRNHIAIQEQTLTLVSNKYKAGLVGNHDVQRARAQLAATRANLAPLEAQVSARAAGIALLLGQQPAAMEQLTQPIAAPDPDSVRLDTGLPQQLIARRPDIAGAEAAWRAATADLGVRHADLYPRISLGGALGLISASSGNLFEGDSINTNAGPMLYLPLLNRGRIKAAIRAAEAANDAAGLTYHQTVLRAQEEVESALAVYNGQAQSLDQWHQAQMAAADAAKTADILYDKGLRDFLTVLDSRREHLRMEEARTQTQTARNLALVNLFQALGG